HYVKYSNLQHSTFFFLIYRQLPRFTLFPYTTLFRSSPPSSRAIPVMLGLFGLLSAVAIALVARYKERAYDAAERLHETTEKSLRSEEHTSELQSRENLVCRLLLEKKKKMIQNNN